MSDAYQHLRHGLDGALWIREAAGLPQDPWQADVLRRRPQRLVLNLHRQAGKSRTMAHLAAHEASFVAGSLTLVVSPSSRQSQLLLLEAERVARLAGGNVGPTRFPDPGFAVAGGGDVVALPGDGAEATTRGYSACTLLLVDEAAKVKEDHYKSARPFLATTNGREVMASTPYGQRGFFWERCVGRRGGPAPGYEVITVPATKCPRITPEFLAEERRDLGERWYLQEYENVFCDVSGSVFDPDAVLQAMSEAVEAFDL